jgi:hypothetical protein
MASRAVVIEVVISGNGCTAALIRATAKIFDVMIVYAHGTLLITVLCFRGFGILVLEPEVDCYGMTNPLKEFNEAHVWFCAL